MPKCALKRKHRHALTRACHVPPQQPAGWLTVKSVVALPRRARYATHDTQQPHTLTPCMFFSSSERNAIYNNLGLPTQQSKRCDPARAQTKQALTGEQDRTAAGIFRTCANKASTNRRARPNGRRHIPHVRKKSKH